METSKHSKTILVVDDSDFIQQMMKEYFHQSGFEIITCHDGLEGIKKTVEYKPDLILLDLMMPNFDGVKMLQVIKILEDLQNIPVIVISANANRRNVMAATEAGADKIIAKPFNKKMIVDGVEEVLGIKLYSSKEQTNFINEKDVDEIKSKLKYYFIKTFVQKKNAILTGIDSCNIEKVKSIVHEIKGTGKAVGLPELTVISSSIENKLDERAVNWNEIEEMSNRMFSIVNTLQN